MGIRTLSGLVAVLALILCNAGSAAPEHKTPTQIKDEILRLTLENTLEARERNEETLLNIENLGLPRDELIDLCVSLLDYYLGEAPDEILHEKTTLIGRPAIPFLIEKMRTPLDCEEAYKERCWEGVAERNAIIWELLAAMKDGIVLYSVLPEDADKELEKDMRTVKIFLRDYETKFWGLPADLVMLREWTWKEYGYTLRIMNPWGSPLRYVRISDDKYTLEEGPGRP
jgi:hypothetical protein